MADDELHKRLAQQTTVQVALIEYADYRRRPPAALAGLLQLAVVASEAAIDERKNVEG